MRRAVLPRGDEDTVRLRTALESRPASRIRRRLPKKKFEPHAEARIFWSERAWSELAAVPAMAQTTLALIREAHSTDVLDVLARIQSDEVRHTELSRDLADAFGGYLEQIPDGSAYHPLMLAEPAADGLHFWIVGNGCLSETFSLELMKTRVKHTTHPGVRPVLSDVLKDEAMHARVCWILAEQVLPKLAPIDLEELSEFAHNTVEMLARSFSTEKLPPAERREARRVRKRVALAGLGAAPPDEEERAFVATRDRIVGPRLARLGVTI
jgi:hypothetical protein